jgi:hypothetical protein
MNDLMQHYSLEYESGSRLYSMTLYGTLDEVMKHADNLGTYEPELIVQIIPLPSFLN